MEPTTPNKFVKLVKMHVLYMMYLIRVHAGKHLPSVSRQAKDHVTSHLVFSTLTTCQESPRESGRTAFEWPDLVTLLFSWS
jgi:hypothetical protein